jgi:hypothetical protein
VTRHRRAASEDQTDGDHADTDHREPEPAVVHAIANRGGRRRDAHGADDTLPVDDRDGDEQKLAADAVTEAPARVDPAAEERNTELGSRCGCVRRPAARNAPSVGDDAAAPVGDDDPFLGARSRPATAAMPFAGDAEPGAALAATTRSET